MASKIEWTDETWNPVGGCSIKSPGCAPCYAQQLAGTRLIHHPLYAGTTDIVKGRPVFNGKMTAAADDHDVWTWPVRWRGAPEETRKLGPGKPSLIFVGDMSDLFHESRDRDHIDRTVAGIIHSRHIGQLLTKRADVMCAYFEELLGSGRWFLFNHPLFGRPNFAPEATAADCVIPRLWLGVSAERQQELDERWPYLRRLAQLGFTIFISYEPALGPLNLPDDLLALGSRVQVIAGGTSGRRAEPSHPGWFRAVRDKCAAAGVRFFFKQWGEWIGGEVYSERAGDDVHGGFSRHQDGQPHFGKQSHWWSGDCWSGVISTRVGKKLAGRLLDGREHNEFPDMSHRSER